MPVYIPVTEISFDMSFFIDCFLGFISLYLAIMSGRVVARAKMDRSKSLTRHIYYQISLSLLLLGSVITGMRFFGFLFNSVNMTEPLELIAIIILLMATISSFITHRISEIKFGRVLATQVKV
jgi:F0F1-type ATP synthase assembly protein I